MPILSLIHDLRPRLARKPTILSLLLAIALPSAPAVDAAMRTRPVPADTAMAQQVRDEFLHARNGHKQCAWGHDELRPLSKTAFDWYGTSFLMTPVDAFDIKLVMGPNQQADEAESAYYLYLATGDPKYREMGHTFFRSIRKYCRTDTAYASLTRADTKQQRDDMESFFFAETLKYLYLLNGKPDAIDLTQVVLNTEAHPLRRTWSSGGNRTCRNADPIDAVRGIAGAKPAPEENSNLA